MKKIFAVTLCILMLTSLVTACRDKDDKRPAKEPKTTEGTSDTICDIDGAVFRYGSGTGTGFSRYYIFGNGDIYGYSERFLNYEGEESDVKESIETLIYNNLKIGTMDKDYLDTLCELATETLDAEREEKHVSEDRGGESAYFIVPETGEEVSFYENGDNQYFTDDEKLQELWDLWENRSEHVTIENETPCFTTEGFCSFNCGYVETDGLTYVVFENEKTFKKTMDSWGIDWKSEVPDLLDKMKDNDRIFVCYQPVSCGGYSLLSSRFYHQGDGVYGFLESTDSYRPDTEDAVMAVMDGFISIGRWRTSDDTYKLPGGGNWTVIR